MRSQARQTHEENIYFKLASVLPPAREASSGSDLDYRAKAMLALLNDRMLKCESTAEPIPAHLANCPNCDTPVLSKTSPYCSECCRQQAAYIRQLRGNIATETILTDEPRQVSKGEVLWRLLGGGLPRRLAQVPEKARERVFKRDGGICQECGAPATTIDNTGSG